MSSFTFDTNCLIAVADARPERTSVLKLIEASRQGQAEVAMLASSASEKQPGGAHLDNFLAFKARLDAMGFAQIELLKPLGKWGMTFNDYCLYGSDETIARELKIFGVLFPNVPSSWTDYVMANGLDADNLTSNKAWKWRNKLCDVQGYWCHEFNKRDYFVTSDANFKKKLTAEKGFPNARILTPQAAAELI